MACEDEAAHPVTSVTVSVAVYDPLAGYVCDVEIPVPVVASP